MFELVSSKNNPDAVATIDLKSLMEVLKMYLVHSSVNTKVNSLRWIHHLFTECEGEMGQHAASLLPVLLGILVDSSEEVVLEGLTVIADIVNANNRDETKKYKEFLESLLHLFKGNKELLENRGTLIIKQLCALLNAEDIYRTLAEILSNESESKFDAMMVRKLNTILFTSSELYELRSTLRNIQDPKSASLFHRLYFCWVSCPISTIALCLLANCFEHVLQLVTIL